MASLTGAQVIARSLRGLGVTVVFGIVGIPVVDIAEEAIDLGIQFIGFRNEQAAGYAASVYGYLTGRPGVCLVVGGPGVLHALPGVRREPSACPSGPSISTTSELTRCRLPTPVPMPFLSSSSLAQRKHTSSRKVPFKNLMPLASSPLIPNNHFVPLLLTQYPMQSTMPTVPLAMAVLALHSSTSQPTSFKAPSPHPMTFHDSLRLPLHPLPLPMKPVSSRSPSF